MFDASPRAPEARPLAGSGLPPAADQRPGVSDYILAMGHELRAPLNAVIGMSALLLEGELAARQRQYAKSIHTAGEGLASILNDLLDLSRLLAGQLPVEPIPFDLRSMVEETANVLSPRAADRGLILRVDWRPELPRQVVGDPGRTRQILGNLVGHAVNATSQGEVVIGVAPETLPNGVPVVRFSVEDTGIGLPPERLDRVFDDYVPFDASPYRSFSVTGLGLRLSAELVRLLGGDIGATSVVGEGSRFWFRLPMPVAESATEQPATQAAAPPGARVLLIENDGASRRRFGEQAADAGWEADYADDLKNAEAKLREAQAAGSPYRVCILSDYAVRPSHAELASRLKADPLLAPVSLVMVTAVGSPGEGKRLWHAGFAAYLRKPVPTDEMHETLRALAQLGPNGRGPSLITRHSLAEARNSEATSQFDRIDEVLASLTAPVTRQALVIGASDADQIHLTEVLAHCGLSVEPVSRPTQARERIGQGSYELVLIDADQVQLDLRDLVADLRSRVGEDGSASLVAMTVDPVRRKELLDAGVDQVITKPVRLSDLDRATRRAEEAPGEPAAASTPAEPDPVAPSAPDPASEPTGLLVEAPTDLVRLEPGMMVAAEPLEGFVASEPGDFSGESAVVEAVDLASVTMPIEPPAAPAPPSLPEPVAATPPEPIEAAEPAVEPTPPPPALDFIDVDEPANPEPESPDATVVSPEAELELPESAPLLPEFELDLSESASDPFDVQPDHVAVEMELLDLSMESIDAPEIVDVVLEIDEVAPEVVDEAPPMVHEAPVFVEGVPEVPDDSLDIADPAPEPVESAPPIEPAEPATTPEPAPAPEPATEPAPELGELSLVLPTDEEEAPDARVPVDARAVEVEVVETHEKLPLVGPSILEQLSSQSGTFAQHLVATFLRDAPLRLADLSVAAGRGDVGGLAQAAKALKAMSGLLGAARLGELCSELESDVARGEVESAASRAPELEHAFLEIRLAVEAVAPPNARMPAELPAIGDAFLEQLAPEREADVRTLAVRLVDSFRVQAPTRLQALVEAIRREDAEAVLRAAPNLKGLCGLISADPMAKMCALVEADARLRRVASARRYIDQLQLELARVLEALDRAVS